MGQRHALTRREFVGLGSVAALGFDWRAGPEGPDIHQQLLALAADDERRRRERFAAVRTGDAVAALQKDLRTKFLAILDGLPTAAGPPPVRVTDTITADDYVIDKLVYESFPGYFVSALLYRPRKQDGRAPAVLSPCGHSAAGKAERTYQIFHVNLVRRGYIVLTYDPVGQGERSQFWNAARNRSRFNLACGEHAVLGNPLYLLGTSLARYRIWDGVCGLDLLAARPDVDAARLGCAGNSGGGTLTAYISALDPRVRAAVISCYITTLPRRMANRIQEDPDADPEQDPFRFVSDGIDHAGLLALRAPRPTLLATARRDFFPIEGARKSFAEAQHLFAAAGAGDAVERVEADERHGLTKPLREAAYAFLDRRLAGREPRSKELDVAPRPARELWSSPDGQVAVSFHSRPLLPLAVEEFRKRAKSPRAGLKELLRLEPASAHVEATEVAPGKPGSVHVVCVNGNEAPDWRGEKQFLDALAGRGLRVTVVDPRGVGRLRPKLGVLGHAYSDPLCGVEENLAYNAFLVGRSLVGLRVADVLKAVQALTRDVVLVARRDAAWVACLTAAVESAVRGAAVEELTTSFWPLFDPAGRPVNAADVLPNLLRDFGDVPDVIAQVSPRPALLAAPRGKWDRPISGAQVRDESFVQTPAVFLDWVQTLK